MLAFTGLLIYKDISEHVQNWMLWVETLRLDSFYDIIKIYYNLWTYSL